MADEHAKPGDVIIINGGRFVGKELTVIEYPEEFLGDDAFPELGKCCWFVWEKDVAFYRDPTMYDIIESRQNPNTTIPDSADDYLDKQRNANLRGVFG